jgi:hypothetical protein
MPNSLKHQKKPQATLIDLMGLIAGVVACSGVVVAGKDAGGLDVFMSWVVGLLVGFGFLWWTRVAMKWAVLYLRLNESKLSPFRLIFSWVFFLIAITWIVFFGFIAAWLTRLAISRFK